MVVMRTKIGMDLVLAALLPFGCKCLSSDQSETPEEQANIPPGAMRNPNFDPSRPRVLDPKKARMLKFGDRLRINDRAQLGVGTRNIPPEVLANTQPASQPSSRPASAPGSRPAASTAVARPPASVKAQF
jgi:hypothetical protein